MSATQSKPMNEYLPSQKDLVIASLMKCPTSAEKEKK